MPGREFTAAGIALEMYLFGESPQIEMHLVSTRPQSVRVPGAGEFVLGEGEMIRTEISCKFDRQSVAEIFAGSELDMLEWWEAPDGMFALSVAEVR